MSLPTFYSAPLPDISILIPAWKAERYIQECLQSIMDADLGGLKAEIVVVDDASPDKTSEQVAAFRPRCSLPIHQIRLQTNSGPGYSRATGAAVAKGEIVFCVDADDLVVQSRFQEQFNLFAADPDLVVAGGDIIEFEAHPDHQTLVIAFPTSHEDIAAEGIFYCPIWGCTTAFRRSLLQLIQYPVQRVGEDWIFAMKAIQHGRAAATGTPVTLYRRHENQTTALPGASLEAVLPVWEEILTMFGLPPTQQELDVHAHCSPYIRTDPGALEALRMPSMRQQWKMWAARLQTLPVPFRIQLSEKIAAINQTLSACQYLRGSQVPIRRLFV